MTYTIGMHQVVVLERDHDGAVRTVRRVLDERLGGAAGVVEAFLAAGGPDYGVAALPSDAVERWRSAADAALDAVHLEFPALMLRLVGNDLDEALGEEFITVSILPTSGTLTNRAEYSDDNS